MDKGKPLYVTEIIRVLGKRRTTLNRLQRAHELPQQIMVYQTGMVSPALANEAWAALAVHPLSCTAGTSCSPSLSVAMLLPCESHRKSFPRALWPSQLDSTQHSLYDCLLTGLGKNFSPPATPQLPNSTREEIAHGRQTVLATNHCQPFMHLPPSSWHGPLLDTRNCRGLAWQFLQYPS
ncbi:uncharacterized protein O9250_002895 isoform 2-T2 [Rhynochetos jubatus]